MAATHTFSHRVNASQVVLVTPGIGRRFWRITNVRKQRTCSITGKSVPAGSTMWQLDSFKTSERISGAGMQQLADAKK